MLIDYTPYALIVDDDPIIRLHASDILQDAGFRVHEASGVDEALKIFKQAGSSILLLVTDVHMPPGTKAGFELARQCAADWPGINIMVVSGVATPEDADLPPGAVFVPKPFTADVVYNRLQQLLAEVKNQKH